MFLFGRQMLCFGRQKIYGIRAPRDPTAYLAKEYGHVGVPDHKWLADQHDYYQYKVVAWTHATHACARHATPRHATP